jgi:hypothetical protein
MYLSRKIFLLPKALGTPMEDYKLPLSRQRDDHKWPAAKIKKRASN